jgi:SAM-dependent methyltransferase
LIGGTAQRPSALEPLRTRAAALRRRSPEVDARYFHALRHIRSTTPSKAPLVDIGSGAGGAATYWRGDVLAFDLAPGASVDWQRRSAVAASVTSLPIADRAAEAVLCLDVLEHLPPPDRLSAMRELVRINGGILVIGMPVGSAASAQDGELARMYEDVRGVSLAFFDEHLEFGLPSSESFAALVAEATEGVDGVEVDIVCDANLALRAFMMRRWIRRSALDKVLWAAMVATGRVWSRVNWGTTYRQFALIRWSG